jgi:hypothetical protein
MILRRGTATRAAWARPERRNRTGRSSASLQAASPRSPPVVAASTSLLRQSRARSAADRPGPWRCCAVCLIRTICRRPPHSQAGIVSVRLGTSPHVRFPHDWHMCSAMAGIPLPYPVGVRVRRRASPTSGPTLAETLDSAVVDARAPAAAAPPPNPSRLPLRHLLRQRRLPSTATHPRLRGACGASTLGPKGRTGASAGVDVEQHDSHDVVGGVRGVVLAVQSHVLPGLEHCERVASAGTHGEHAVDVDRIERRRGATD